MSTDTSPATCAIALLWRDAPPSLSLAAVHGRIERVLVAAGSAAVDGQSVRSTGGALRLHLLVAEAWLLPGGGATTIEVHGDQPLAFFLRDVQAANPIHVPAAGFCATTVDDARDPAAIAADLAARGLRSEQQRLADGAEPSFAEAAATCRDQTCPTWLGLGGDLRFFRLHHDEAMGYFGWLQPATHQWGVPAWPDLGGKQVGINLCLGRGSACRSDIVRRLDDGVLPILTARQRDGEIDYELCAFAGLERPLPAGAPRGSDWRAAYACTGGNMLGEAERSALAPLLAAELAGREEEVVCWMRITARNRAAVPRYAWFKAPHVPGQPTSHDPERGTVVLSSGRVLAVCRLAGQPMREKEVAVLLQPGGSVTVDLRVPWQPLPPERAAALAAQDHDQHLEACRAWWRARLATAATIELPEVGISERLRAGLLHLDISTIGRSDGGPLLANVGMYSPIGSESAPMILAYDALGWHRQAERCLDFFLARARGDGFIQNFGSYEAETAPVLWAAGEHWRTTRDRTWLARVLPALLRSADWLLRQREASLADATAPEHLRGLLRGKIADPEDRFHAFMLNAYVHLGLVRLAEAAAVLDAAQGERLATAAAALRRDVRRAFHHEMGRSPLVPLGDGSWAPMAPPWGGRRGPCALYAEGEPCHTHGAFASRDSLIGALPLVHGGVLDADEPAVTAMLASHQELMTVGNAGLSQPYYVRHDWIHLLRGEVHAYLALWYRQMAALQDRETYSCWEHYFHASEHKTHEEAWMMLQTLWMLAREEDGGLALLSAIPRAWLRDGSRIRIERLATVCGPLSLVVESQHGARRITARIALADTTRRPRHLRLRLPHPAGLAPIAVAGGTYDRRTESVLPLLADGMAEVELRY